MKTRLILLAVCILFGGLRFVVPVSGIHAADTFKDAAHVFVGGLFGAAIATRRRDLWAMAVGLTLVEIVAALVR